MRPWSLGHLTVAQARPYELVQIAARAGYAAVDPFVGLVQLPSLPMVQLKAGDLDTVRLRDELAATGLIFNVADAFLIDAETDFDDVRRMIGLVAELGARSINTILFDPDLMRGTAALAALDVQAKEAGLTVLIEFLAISSIDTLVAARHVIDSIGSSNIGLMVDALHASYAGVRPVDLRAHKHLIRGAQLCDGPARLSREDYERMMIEERGVPGTGELPLVQFMAELPEDLICAIEVPRPDEPDLVIRAKRLLEAGRSCDRAAS